MDDQTILTKTGKGARALSECERTGGKLICRVLALVDGHAALADIRRKMSDVASDELSTAVSELLRLQFVKELSHDSEPLDGPSTIIEVTELNEEDGAQEWAEAQQAAAGLAQDGYCMVGTASPRGAKNRRILLVDDDPAIGQLVSSILAAEGCTVRYLEDSRQTLDWIRSDPDLALVLLDVMMPHLDGFKVLREIRRLPQFDRLPVVMLTSLSEPKYVREGLRCKANGYILKPIKAERLVRYLRDTLAKGV